MHGLKSRTVLVTGGGIGFATCLRFAAEGAGNRDKPPARAVPMRPEDPPGAIPFPAGDDAAFVAGQVLSVSGGLTMNG